MIQGAAAAGAAAVALQLLKVAILMAALTEARLTVVAVDSAPEVALEVVVIMLAGLRDIEVGAVEVLNAHLDGIQISGDHFIPMPLTTLRIPLAANPGLTKRLNDDTT